MNNDQTSPQAEADVLTQHAMLVAWGVYAQHIGLVKRLEKVKLHQKTRDHTPQKKVLEFLVATLAGVPHLKDISRAAHPLDQDVVTAEAWGQKAWADYSGVSRTLQSLTETETAELIQVLDDVEKPVLDQEIELALHQNGCLVYDGDLTGRPVSSTSISYPDAAFGYMGDGVELGYQAAVVSVGSPTFGRLWVVDQLHSGDTVSSSQAQALVKAAEARTGVRPLRRSNLVADRLAQIEAARLLSEEQREESQFRLHEAKGKVQETADQLAHWQQEIGWLEADYQRDGRMPTPHCRLTRARQKLKTFQTRLPRVQAQLAKAQRRFDRHDRAGQALYTEAEQLKAHLAALESENQANPTPIRAIFRLDSGFATQENMAWMIEMGYDLYTKARAPKIKERLLAAATTENPEWVRVGDNAHLTAWPQTTVEGSLPYPMDVALAHYQTGDTQSHAVLLHYGQDPVTQDVDGWFHMYNGRQTIEAGIKEGKGVFQMHHLKVRSTQALLLQERFACFAANFVRRAAHWLSTQEQHLPPMQGDSVKHLVQVSANTSAWVRRQGDVWLLTFTKQSLYAGYSLQLGGGIVQLPLPFMHNIHFHHF